MPDARKDKGQDSKKHIETVRDFRGVNTTAVRTAISASEFSWLENWMPTGFANMQSVNAPVELGKSGGGAILTYSSNIYSIQFVSINNIDTLLLFGTDGSLTAVKTDGTSNTVIAPAATFSGAGSRTTSWKNNQALIIDANGYFNWDGTFAAGHVTHITGTGVPASGTDIAVYAGRVWIVVTGRSVTFSGPDDYTAAGFAAAVGSGTFIISDVSFRGDIQRLFVANGYMYIFGKSGINVVSDVRIPSGATPPLPVFTNLNINAIIGTPFPDSVTLFNRSVCFANQFGFFALDGVTVTRLSDEISGTVQQIIFGKVSAGTAVVNNILCLCFAFTFVDPTTNQNRDILGIYFDKKWYFATQFTTAAGVMGTSVTQIVSCFVSNTPSLAQLTVAGANKFVFIDFADATVNISRTIRTALFPGESSVITKQATKVGVEMNFTSVNGSTSVQVSNELGLSSVAEPIMPTSTTSVLTWVNGSNAVLTWQNGASLALAWEVSGANPVIASFSGYNTEQSGKYLGIDMTSTTPSAVLSAMHLEFENRRFWGNPTTSTQ